MDKLFSITALMILLSANASAKEFEKHDALMNHGDGHLMDMGGAMVMGQNTDTLPGGCDEIAATKEITVHAGHKYAEKFPGRMWAFDTQEYKFEPCTKLTVHFVNDDSIRHQWMMHGLPKYLYPRGMFHLEVSGPGEVSGTLILPPGNQTYLVHCDMAQHMEKGLKAQLKVGKGSGDLPSIPGITANIIEDDYNEAMPPPVVLPAKAGATPAKVAEIEPAFISATMLIGLVIGLLLMPFLARQFKGMSVAEIVAYSVELLGLLFNKLSTVLVALFKLILPNKTKHP
ncbi:MAG: copper oxidase [Methylococcaceae bacterium]|nr:copper oxidase [Methylococcaceae bacterium]